MISLIVVLCQGGYGTKRGKCDAYHTKPDNIPMYALCNDSGVCKLHTIIVCAELETELGVMRDRAPRV